MVTPQGFHAAPAGNAGNEGPRGMGEEFFDERGLSRQDDGDKGSGTEVGLVELRWGSCREGRLPLPVYRSIQYGKVFIQSQRPCDWRACFRQIKAHHDSARAL